MKTSSETLQSSAAIREETGMLKVTADNCSSAYQSIIALEMFTNKLYPTRTHLSMGALVNVSLTLEIGALDVYQKP